MAMPINPYNAKHETAVVWFRRDLRISDNPALAAALQSATSVIPLFIWAPEEEGQFQPGRANRWWLRNSLLSLSAELERLGSRLVCMAAPDCQSALCHVLASTGATALFTNRLYDPITMVRDNELLARVAGLGVRCFMFNSDLLYEPWEVLDQAGKPFDSFDAFWGRVTRMPHPPLPPIPAPVALPVVPGSVGGTPIDSLGLLTEEELLTNQQLEFTWSPGSAGAHKLFAKFVSKRLRQFQHDRAKSDRNSTSRLSPHVHFGEVSVRYMYYVVKQKEAEWLAAGERITSCADFLQQMGYREYSRYLSWHFPFTHERSLLEHVRACPYRMDQRLFKAWRQGNTGYPLVDASMRELWSSGWMHNRMRVTAASFLVKHLLLPWQWGLKHFWDALVDADLEADALGWQYCAGCLADAHPLDYMIDHSTESKRFDPDGQYVRRWLPVLGRLPRQYIHEPWTAPQHVLDEAGVELGSNYPWPVVDAGEAQVLLGAAKDVVDAALEALNETQRGPYRPPSLNPLDPSAPDSLRRMYAKFQHQLTRTAESAASGQRPSKRAAMEAAAQQAGEDMEVCGQGQFGSCDNEEVESNMCGGMEHNARPAQSGFSSGVVCAPPAAAAWQQQRRPAEVVVPAVAAATALRRQNQQTAAAAHQLETKVLATANPRSAAGGSGSGSGSGPDVVELQHCNGKQQQLQEQTGGHYPQELGSEEGGAQQAEEGRGQTGGGLCSRIAQAEPLGGCSDGERGTTHGIDGFPRSSDYLQRSSEPQGQSGNPCSVSRPAGAGQVAQTYAAAAAAAGGPPNGVDTRPGAGSSGGGGPGPDHGQGAGLSSRGATSQGVVHALLGGMGQCAGATAEVGQRRHLQRRRPASCATGGSTQDGPLVYRPARGSGCGSAPDAPRQDETSPRGNVPLPPPQPSKASDS